MDRKLRTCLRFAVMILFCVTAIFSITHITSFTQTQNNPLYTNSTYSNLIKIDGIGYRPGDTKIATLANPVQGFNADLEYIPSSAIQVRIRDTDQLVGSYTPISWNDGGVDPMSGDQIWHVDFSDVNDPGIYYLLDPESNLRSEDFYVAENVYRPALIQATRFFYHQRANTAKSEQFAQGHSIGIDYNNPSQDFNARNYLEPSNPATEKDLSGGWWDAGDTNKYTTNSAKTVQDLLLAYQNNPTIWTDDFSIPESGNGIPDIIDEIIFELEYLEKLQDENTGLVINKVGFITDDTTDYYPETDPRLRYYGPYCTSSTIAAASVFAHASAVFRDIPATESYADTLESRAIDAYKAFVDAPTLEEACDDQTIKAGDSDVDADDQRGMQAIAALHLFTLTGEGPYKNDIATYLSSTTSWGDLGWSIYDSYQGEILLRYAQSPQSDPTIAQDIIDRYSEVVRFWTPSLWGQSQDAYLSSLPLEQYHWGSNRVIASSANANILAFRSGLIPEADSSYINRALHHLNYLHGVNAFGMAFVVDEQNEFGLGLQSTVQNIFHQQFSNPNSVYATKLPPSGYLVGGINPSYSGSRQNELVGEPTLKQYIDTAENWPVNSWEFSEPSISYQSQYVRLLSEFVATTQPFDESSLIATPIVDVDADEDMNDDEMINNDQNDVDQSETDTNTQSPQNDLAQNPIGVEQISDNEGSNLQSNNSQFLGANSTDNMASLVRSGGQVGLSLVWAVFIGAGGFWIDSLIKQKKPGQ